MTRTASLVLAAMAWLFVAAAPAAAQSSSDDGIGVQGFAMAGLTVFSATKTFDAILDRDDAPIFGGGVRLTLPRGPYLEVGAWRMQQDGERVFIGANDEVFRLGIPTTIRMTPLEVTAGWRFRGLFGRRFTPHFGAGYTSMRYEETSEFADDGENVSERFNGFHLTGGVEARLHRWVALAGDLNWTSIGNALGEGGVSREFGEDDLGGTSIRIRLILGR